MCHVYIDRGYQARIVITNNIFFFPNMQNVTFISTAVTKPVLFRPSPQKPNGTIKKTF